MLAPTKAKNMLASANITAMVFWGDSLALAQFEAALGFFGSLLGKYGTVGNKLDAHAPRGAPLLKWIPCHGTHREYWSKEVRKLPGAIAKWREEVAKRTEAPPTRAGRTLVFSNFAVLHEMIPRDLQTLRGDISRFAQGWEEELASAPPDITKFWRDDAVVVFGPPPALHKFRQPFCTYERAKAIGRAYSKTLAERLGWQVLDVHAMTDARPESAKDGMHYDESLTAVWNAALVHAAASRPSARSGT